MSSRAYDRYWEKLNKEREKRICLCLTEEDQRAYNEKILPALRQLERVHKCRAFADD